LVKKISKKVDASPARVCETFRHSKYRPDIDGLRAVAVLLVVAHHAFPHWLTGGFVGVDVFFVISGFLISTIVFENLERGTFSFGEFYYRRVRRIIPSLIVVMAAVLILGWLLLAPGDYKRLGLHVVGGAGFLSNFLLWHEGGYFDVVSSRKPLLHLWTLGVEEQFYLLWPLLLFIGWRLRANLLVVTLLVAGASFAFNIALRRIDPVGLYYSPLTRFWELLSGAALSRLMLQKPSQVHIRGVVNDVASGVGIIFIVGTGVMTH